MSMDVLNAIYSRYNDFTKNERKVADYVLQQPKEVLYVTITDLAERCGVADSTVFRFCKSVGLNGYQQFKVMLAQSFSSSRHDESSLVDDVNIHRSTFETCKEIRDSHIDSIELTYKMLNYEDLNKCVDLLSNARRIHFFGVGSSGTAAQEARNRFIRINPDVNCIIDTHVQTMAASVMQPDDLAICFSYSGSTKDMIDILGQVKSNNAKSICITRFAKSPMTQYADVILLSGVNDSGSPFPSKNLLAVKAAQLFLIDILYAEYYKRNFEACNRNKEKSIEPILKKLI